MLLCSVQSLLPPSFCEDSRRVNKVPLVCFTGDYRKGMESNAGMTIEVKQKHFLSQAGTISQLGNRMDRWSPSGDDYLVKQNGILVLYLGFPWLSW